MNTTRLSLIELVQAGDPAGWDRFIKLYRRFIEYWAKTNGAAGQDLDDICQGVYCVLVSRLADFRLRERTGSFRCWLKSITRFVCLEQKRKRGGPANGKGGTEAVIHLNNIQDPIVGTFDANSCNADSFDPDSLDADIPDPPDLVNDLVQRAINLVRSECSSRDWSVVEMVVLEKKSPKEVAAALGETPTNIRQIKSRFLRRLRSELDGFSPAVIGKYPR